MKSFRKLKNRIIDFMIRILVKEHRGYRHRFPHDLDKLRATLRPGDVVLVEGSQRISEVIKYLTQSSWSHAAIYVGDTIVKRGGHRARDVEEAFGGESVALLVEATVEEGVAAAPLSKYVNHNLRICRPINLRPGDLTTVLETVISQIGNPYNVRHIVDLARYFFPVTLLGRFRRQALAHSGSVTKDVICSSQIAMAFQKVRYPVQPAVAIGAGRAPEKRRVPEWLSLPRRRRARNSVLEKGIFTPCDPHTITPRDFDLSPYFQVVKMAADDSKDFDYKKMNWFVPEAEPRAEGARETEKPASVSTADVSLPAGTKAG
jgi:hypothetical protein